MTNLYLIIKVCFASLATTSFLFGQTFNVDGKVINSEGNAVDFATVALKSAADSSLIKVEMTDLDGAFVLVDLKPSDYIIEVSFLGYENYMTSISVKSNNITIPEITLVNSSMELDEVTVTAQRRMVEVRPDRTVFNVQGTVNSAGENALDLMRKAPGVLIDNNDNITVMSRSGTLIYIDGKRLPLTGDDLSAYLKSLTSEQIDRIDIITNPGAKYEAQGNAGIIDIRLKKAENEGINGSVSATGSKGRYYKGNLGATGNYRNKSMNVFANAGYNAGDNWNELIFKNFQNGFLIDENNQLLRRENSVNYRLGTDYFINKNSTIGFLYSGQYADYDVEGNNTSNISGINTQNIVDSVLIAKNETLAGRLQNTFNINYVYNKDKTSLNIDLDYGRFDNDASTFQPNQYFNQQGGTLLSENNVRYTTPVKIDIATAKLDYEFQYGKSSIGVGGKFSKVITDNTFKFSNIIDGNDVQNDRRSNLFNYDESVSAGYVNLARPFSQFINFTAGLRAEYTNAVGELTAFADDLQEDPVTFDYISFFPSLGITYSKNPMHNWAFNYGRRINRPDYNVLNPFREQLSELSFSNGNPFLRPEIVNNVELGYTFAYMYNVKVGYSLTTDQITRLIGPDEIDPRAGFISYDNLATQETYSINFSAPIQIQKWWNAYFNINAAYINNQADYGDGGIVDVQAGTYTVFSQQTFNLPSKWRLELSGFYSGPGVWGGVFRYNPTHGINVGLQRKFFKDQVNLRIAFNDITYSNGWDGVSEFNGLRGEGQGNYDSRRGTISINYSFGNSKVKSRNRKTGIENEAGRVGS